MTRTPLPDHPLDWRVVSSRYALNERWIKVRADVCQLPNGEVFNDPFYILEYPDWVNVVALTAENEVILTREYRHGIARTILELPSGGVNPGESPLQAAQRELLEETGYGGGAWEPLCQLSPNPGNHTNLAHSFLARGVTLQGSQQLDPTEQIEVVRLPLAEVINLLMQNQFMQAMHTAALFYALQRL